MEETGIVRSVSGVMATVFVEKKSVCDQCQAGCPMTESGAEIEAINQAKAKVGEKVRVVMKPYTYLKGSVLVYGVPALALVIGAVAGKEFLGRFLPHIDPDTSSAIFGFGAFILSFAFIKYWISKAEKKTEYKPVIEEILKG